MRSCQALLCVSVQRTFCYFFKLCGISLLLVSGIFERLCMCVRVEVKMYI